MNNSRSHIDAVMDRRNLSGGERLVSLNRSIELIERKLNQMGRSASTPVRTATNSSYEPVPSRIQELERRLKNLTRTHEQFPEPSTIQPTNVTESSAGGMAYSDTESAMAEISRRKQALYNTGIPAVSNNNTDYNPESSELFSTISTDVRGLGEKIEHLQRQLSGDISGLSQYVANTARNASPSDELARISDGIRELQQSPRFDPSAFDALHNELDDLRLSIGTPVLREDIDNGFAELNTRLDKISSDMPQSLMEIRAKLDGFASNQTNQNNDLLAEQISTLDQTVGSLSQSMEVSKIDQRLEALARAIDQLAKTESSSGSSSPDLTAIETRLDEITRAIVAVSVNGQRGSDNDAAATERLEEQLAILAQGVDNISTGRDDAQLASLSERIEKLAHQMEILDGNIQNSANGQMFADADASGLDRQIEELASRIDAAIGSAPTENQLSGLEMQIAGIAEQLSNTTGPSLGNLSNMEDRLGKLEQSIAANQDLTLEAIAQAAHTTMNSLDGDNFSTELVGALSEDLKALKAVANQSDNNSAEALRKVEHIVSGVANRLDSIEASLLSAKNPRQSAAQSINQTKNLAQATTAVDRTSQISSRTSAGNDVSILDRIDQAPSIDPSAEIGPAGAIPANSSSPKPGPPSAPDISSLITRVDKKPEQSPSGTAPYVDKTDFVAAARRAAQSAVAEVQAIKVENPNRDGKPAKSAKISAASVSSRRPIIFAAAAILMAVVAFAGTRIYLGIVDDGSTTTVKIPTKSSMAAGLEKPGSQVKLPETGNVPVARAAVPRTAVPTDPAKPGQTEMTAKPSMSAPAAASGFQPGSKPKQTDTFISSLIPPGEGENSEPTAGTANTSAVSNVNQASSANSQPQETVGNLAGGSGTMMAAELPPKSIGPVSLRQAAAKGDMKAQYEVGLRYTNGKGIKRDLAEAAIWYERAAAQEFAPAQYRLGSLYEKGLGVKRDLATAANWYLRAADLGNARAMHNLAVISAMGTNGTPDMERALNWFEKAANLGVKDSQFNLGIIYGQGMGVSQDLEMSYKWFAISAKTGDKDSAKKRDEVANVMEPKALEAARLVVRGWRPEKLVDRANRVVIPEEWRSNSAKSAAINSESVVHQAQAALNKLGYSLGKPDGITGPKTRRAILAFQKKAGLPATGKVDAQLIRALKGMNI